MAEGINVQPMMDMGGGKGHDGMGGGWMWIILIFVLLLGGGGLGGLGGANGAAAATLNNDFLYTQQKIDTQTAATNAGFATTMQAMNAGFAGVNANLCDNRHAMDMGFCNVGRSIDQVRFEAAQNTCAITSAITQSTQNIKDLINGNTMQDLRDRNGDLANALNNAQQTAAIINQLRPYPTPSYYAPNPAAQTVQFAAPYAPFGFGYPGFGGCEPRGCDPCGHGVL